MCSYEWSNREEGNHEELLKLDGEYSNLYNKQFELLEEEKND